MAVHILEGGQTLGTWAKGVPGVAVMGPPGPGEKADFIAVGPDWRGTYAARCRILLLPGDRSALAESIQADWIVTYGLSPRDSLTLSSLGEGGAVVALQRELVTLSGHRLERQEVLVPWGGEPMDILVRVGIWLLTGGEGFCQA